MSVFTCTTDVLKIIAQLYNAIILMTAGPCETYCIHKEHDLYDRKFKVKCIVTLLNPVCIIFAEALTEILPLPKIQHVNETFKKKKRKKEALLKKVRLNKKDKPT